MLTDPEEIFDLVDESGAVIGQAPRKECHRNPALLHRVVHVLVAVEGRGLLLQKRSLRKDIQPGKWDTSVGGHFAPGETLAQAALRELQEELGVAVDFSRLVHCYQYIMRSQVETEMVDTFTISHNGPFNFPEDEIDEIRWWPEGAVKAGLGTGAFTPNFEDEFARFQKWQEK